MSIPPATAEEPPAQPAPTQATDSGSRISAWWLSALSLVLTLAAYWPTFSNGFVNYDDNGYVVQNHFVQNGLNSSSIKWAFRATIMANWHPLTWISHMLDFEMFRLNPAGHHASSLVLHSANVLLLFLLLYKATGLRWRSFLVAALFAVLPLNVESVAWIAERKTLLSTFFLFLALFAYGWYVRKPGITRYLLVALLFAMGLASKPMVITLPFALLLLDYWPLCRLPVPDTAENRPLFWKRFSRLSLEKLPLLLLCAASAYITVIAQARTNTIAANNFLPFSVRLANALWSYLMYIARAIWPAHLAIFYPHPEYSIGFLKPVLALALFVPFSIYCLSRLRERYLLVGWLWYLGCLVPVIGVVQVGRQAMADRYAYTPLIGILLLAVWWVADHAAQLRLRNEAIALPCAAVLVLFSALTWRQIAVWHDSFALFEHALQVSPQNFIAENNLGEAYMQIGRPDLAYDHFLRATQEKPRFGLAHYNLGLVLVGQNRRAEACREFQAAIQYGQEAPDIASAYHNLGVVLLDDNQLANARDLFSQALRFAPNRPSSLLARGMAEFRLNDYSSAEADFSRGVALLPDPSAFFWLGRAREAQGNLTGATDAYRQALALQPNLETAKTRLDALASGRPLPFLSQENN